MSDQDARVRFTRAASNRLLGMELVEHTATHARVRLPARDELLQEEGVVHGGFVTTLADTAAVYVLLPGLPEGDTLASVELKVNFLAPARAGAGDLVADATLVQRGRTIAVVEVEVVQGDRRVAKGLFTYLQAPRRT